MVMDGAVLRVVASDGVGVGVFGSRCPTDWRGDRAKWDAPLRRTNILTASRNQDEGRQVVLLGRWLDEVGKRQRPVLLLLGDQERSNKWADGRKEGRRERVVVARLYTLGTSPGCHGPCERNWRHQETDSTGSRVARARHHDALTINLLCPNGSSGKPSHPGSRSWTLAAASPNAAPPPTSNVHPVGVQNHAHVDQPMFDAQ